MALIPGLVLLLLGLAIGFIIAWAFGVFSAGFSTSLFVGLVLLIAGIIVGFVLEWLIDEAYRKNHELQRQLRERDEADIKFSPASPPVFNEPIEGSVPQPLSPSGQTTNTTSENLAIYWRQRDEELQEIQRQLTHMNAESERLRLSFEAYQRTHPDNLTLIKGIGPVFQWKLRDIGISSYKQLALADPTQVRRQLDIKKWQRVNIEAWVEQARDWMQRDS